MSSLLLLRGPLHRTLVHRASASLISPPTPPAAASRYYSIKTGSTILPISTALTLVCTSGRFATFDETVSLHLQVTLDPRKPNQNIREKISLPHGTGKQVSILVLTDDDGARSVAEELGAHVPDSTLAEGRG